MDRDKYHFILAGKEWGSTESKAILFCLELFSHCNVSLHQGTKLSDKLRASLTISIHSLSSPCPFLPSLCFKHFHKAGFSCWIRGTIFTDHILSAKLHYIHDMLHFDIVSPNKAMSEVNSWLVDLKHYRTMISSNMACVLKLWDTRLLSFFHHLLWGLIGSVSHIWISVLINILGQQAYLCSVSIPFWNMDDKGRWPLWPLLNAKWNLLVNWSSGCKYFSACHKAERWSPKSKKG